ncbi:AsnC family transcriptional regulator [Acetobacter indonesiensis NRIC 0313]|uniref:Transcriptional regulator n=1 Tax=Acetobacter indonesiensis TaxID=104101 RepID=A0A252AWB1_9PROT|nr:Lrp/AsnC family transcriptional regulator [Acetobacter indonesiensis]OUI94470.1 transcriptional regulator [Acetobacter indonesiensis]OUI94923.1 transcriptional regulator [Acetobacter indonesiensis]GAN63484.1 transcriptional regulator Lrp/AsnC [Acetobacter indonesiensis]GBQ56120.1 AsnC family transcriptional regulator [Acetobacter indonesiensis NRIC 0313]GEN02867.1 transcriptional regulator [Acetobacter indonesiensis]
MDQKLDQIDRSILRALQQDASLSQRDLAERVGMSQNACWRRLQALRATGVLQGETARINRAATELDLTVFVLIKTRHHAQDWLNNFKKIILSIPNIVDFYRIAGEYDYMLKIVARDMNAFDAIYRQMIEKIDIDTVTSYMAMEAIADNRPLPL